MILRESAAAKIVNKLASQGELLDILMDVETYLDESNLYVFDNWIKGVVVSGPQIKKYWIDITLKYDHDQMPDPDGGLRLTPHGTKVKFQKAQELVSVEIKSPDDYEPGTNRPKMKKKPIWLVHLSIPRRFVDAVNQDMLDQYDDEAEDMENAEDQLSKGPTL
jgi:hypothetical protein